MTKEEVILEVTQRVLEAVDVYDKAVQRALTERRQTLAELNEWFSKAYKEATDGEISGDAQQQDRA